MAGVTITTPEHVPIRLEPAGAGSRFLAMMIDTGITTTASATIAGVASIFLPNGVAAAILVTLSLFLAGGWHIWFETRSDGRTPGKRVLALRVMDERGLSVSFFQSLIRNFMRVVDFAPLFYGFGAIATLVSPRRQRLGDLVAGTLVIRDARSIATRGRLAAIRRHNTLRNARVQRAIRHRISLDEREFLLALCLRAEKLSPSARYDLMESVAGSYREKLGIEEEQISGENLVRDLTAILFAK